MVIQNISSDQKTTDITFTVKRSDVSKTKKILKEKSKIVYKDVIYNEKVVKVSIVGAEWSLLLVLHTKCLDLSDEEINILAISTSEIKLSVIIDEEIF